MTAGSRAVAHNALSPPASVYAPEFIPSTPPSQLLLHQTPPADTQTYARTRSGTRSITLPGTFKSMVHAQLTGDLTITINGYASLNELFHGNRAASRTLSASSGMSESSRSDSGTIQQGGTSGLGRDTPPSPAAEHVRCNSVGSTAEPSKSVEYRSDEIEARIQLTYRAQSHSSMHELANAVPRRHVIPCRGRFHVSNATKKNHTSANSGMNNLGGGVGSGNTQAGTESWSTIKQYEMMFVQTDFQPGQPFFALNFSKTLVQKSSNGGGGHAGKDEDPSAMNVPPPSNQEGRGLMLSGHYSSLRNYDLGTVRVHLPAGSLTGDLAPSLMVHSSSSPVATFGRTATPLLGHSKLATSDFSSRKELMLQQQRRREEEDEYARYYEHLLPEEERQQQQQQSFVAAEPQLVRMDSVQSAPPPPPSRTTRYCYGCGESGHLHKDCPRDQLFCYNCNQNGHSSKNCRKPKPWEQQQKQQQRVNSPVTPPGFPSMSRTHSQQSVKQHYQHQQQQQQSHHNFHHNGRSTWNSTSSRLNESAASHESPQMSERVLACGGSPATAPMALTQAHYGSPASTSNAQVPYGSWSNVGTVKFDEGRFTASTAAVHPSTSPPNQHHQAVHHEQQHVEQLVSGVAMMSDSKEFSLDRCYLCGSAGHAAKLCVNGKKCFNCDMFGHYSYECVQPKRDRGMSLVGCRLCGSESAHRQRDCPNLSFGSSLEDMSALSLTVLSECDESPSDHGLHNNTNSTNASNPSSCHLKCNDDDDDDDDTLFDPTMVPGRRGLTTGGHHGVQVDLEFDAGH